MLGKLMKKDLTATARYFIPLILGFAGATILGKILFEIALNGDLQARLQAQEDQRLYEMFTILGLVYLSLYIIYFIAYYIMTSVFIVYDFYKTMVSDQAYLTHTLPVKASTLIWSKTLTAVIWQMAAGLMILLAALLFMAGHFADIPAREITDFIHYMYGMSTASLCLYMAASILLSAFCGPLMFFASIAIGHLFGRHRIIGAIASYMGIYTVLQILTTVVMVCMGYRLDSNYDMSWFFGNFMIYTLCYSVVAIAVFYWITNRIFSRNLNLE